MPAFTRIMLYVGALTFLVFGLWLLVNPAGLAATGLPVEPGSLWRVEIRAFYGGLEIGFGTFLLLCARRPGWALPGLTAAALVLCGAGLARAAGLVLDHRADTSMLAAVAAELGGAVLSAAAYRAHCRWAQAPMAATCAAVNSAPVGGIGVGF